MKYHVLLLEDLPNHGRKGELAYAAPGFARNYLLPKGKAILASFATVKLQGKLKNEREEQAKKDKAESEKIIASLKGKSFSTVVKVDHDGHMYGSVSVKEIVDLLFNEGIEIAKKQITLSQPIRYIGTHTVTLKFPEEMSCTVAIEVKPDRVIEKKAKVLPVAEVTAEDESAEETKEEKSEE